MMRGQNEPTPKWADLPVSRLHFPRTSLVAHWLRIHLPMQGTRVQSLIQGDPTCLGATKPLRHNYWAHAPQLLKPARLEPVLRNQRSHCNEKTVHCNKEWPPLPATRESPCRNEDPTQPKINKIKILKVHFKKLHFPKAKFHPNFPERAAV